MQDTKEAILRTALALFSAQGFEAVSVSDIAGALHMTKGALYRHYENKQAIFDAILRRMEQRDTELAEAEEMPLEGESSVITLQELFSFSKTMLRYWVKDDFAAAFRRMLTVEQYRSETLLQLYQQYLAMGPVEYVAMLLTSLQMEDAEEKARTLCGIMHLCYSLCDASADADRELARTERILDELEESWSGK